MNEAPDPRETKAYVKMYTRRTVIKGALKIFVIDYETGKQVSWDKVNRRSGGV